ncbi:unnamed protein product [Sphagnum tenellum]
MLRTDFIVAEDRALTSASAASSRMRALRGAFSSSASPSVRCRMPEMLRKESASRGRNYCKSAKTWPKRERASYRPCAMRNVRRLPACEQAACLCI